MKIAFLFPGQGSQYVGMGKDLCEKYDEVNEIYEKAKKITGIDVKEVSFEDKEEKLNQTKYTQLCIVTMSLGILEVLKKNNIQADMTAGLSLGEYVSLNYANSIDTENTLKIIQKRGEYMQDLAPKGEWSMVAVLGLPDNLVEEACSEVKNGFAVPANYNCPGQVVVSGDKIGITELTQIAKEKGAKRVVELKTSGPFHTKKLEEASKKLKAELEKIEIKVPDCVVIKNLDGKSYNTNENIKEVLEKHIISPVKFSDSIKYMLENGVDTFIEVGPGKTLTSLVRKIDRNVNCINISDVASLGSTIELLNS